MHKNIAIFAGLCFQVACLAPAPAHADPVADFYAGRNVIVAIASGPVGAYADYGQLLVAHMKTHMPGKPNFVFQTMPGAGGMVATNHAYNVAPKDGTHILVVPQNFATSQALKMPAVRYDARRFNLIGRFNDNTPVAVGWTPAGVTSVDVLRQREVFTSPVRMCADLPRLVHV